jgi:ribonuclease HI
MVVWLKIGFISQHFFSINSVQTWLQEGASSSRSIFFLSGLRWIWRHRNLMCLGNETLSLHQLCSNIDRLHVTINSVYSSAAAPKPDKFIRWNNDNFQCIILNIDGSCNGDPTRTGYGGILRNHTGSFISAFSGYIDHSQDILFAELSALYQGLTLAINLNYEEVACYTDSLLTVKLIKEDLNQFHVYAVLIQNIKDLLISRNYSLHHSLREGNQCADWLAKLGASNDVALAIHTSPPERLLPLLHLDEVGTLFLRR